VVPALQFRDGDLDLAYSDLDLKNQRLDRGFQLLRKLPFLESPAAISRLTEAATRA